MIRILVDIENVEDDAYNMSGKFEPAEDSTAYGVLDLCTKAMILEGYSSVSIIKALKELSEDMIDTLEINEIYLRKFKDESKNNNDDQKNGNILCKDCDYCDELSDSPTNYVCHREGRFCGDYVDLYDTCEYTIYEEFNEDDK